MKVAWDKEMLTGLLMVYPTLTAVGQALGCTTERVRQVAKKYGLKPRRGRIQDADRWLIDLLPLADVMRLTGASRQRLVRDRKTPSFRPFRTWKNRCVRRVALAFNRDGETQTATAGWVSDGGPPLSQMQVARWIVGAGQGVGRSTRTRGHRPQRAETIRVYREQSRGGS